jgi:peptide/nickel transport system substrate-binding protein
MTWAIHVTLAPSWLDPSETLALATPYMLLYALHDALVKPMPANPMAPSLATAWRESEDGRTYDFELRQGVKFHNGDPFTAEDVQFSFERYKGASAGELKQKVKGVEVVNAHHIRFRLHEPWPDFMTFYGTMAAGVGWIVPKKYIETVGTTPSRTTLLVSAPIAWSATSRGSRWSWRRTRTTGARPHMSNAW